MARAGVYKWDVKEARDKLIERGQNPSIDAVRMALGNTGSKTTIHRYLKELDADESATDHTPQGISETLSALVSQLADQIHREATQQLQEATAQHKAATERFRTDLTAAQQEALRWQDKFEDAEVKLGERAAENTKLQGALTKVGAENQRLIDQLRSAEKLAEEQAKHFESSERKHEQAREALEHFRTMAREQREQDQQRHEGEVQTLQAELRIVRDSLTEKQSQMTAVTKEAAALSSEFAAVRKELTEVKGLATQLEKESSKLREQVGAAKASATSSHAETRKAAADAEKLSGELETSRRREHELEISAAKDAAKANILEQRCEDLQKTLEYVRVDLARAQQEAVQRALQNG